MLVQCSLLWQHLWVVDPTIGPTYSWKRSLSHNISSLIVLGTRCWKGKGTDDRKEGRLFFGTDKLVKGLWYVISSRYIMIHIFQPLGLYICMRYQLQSNSCILFIFGVMVAHDIIVLYQPRTNPIVWQSNSKVSSSISGWMPQMNLHESSLSILWWYRDTPWCTKFRWLLWRALTLKMVPLLPAVSFWGLSPCTRRFGPLPWSTYYMALVGHPQV